MSVDPRTLRRWVVLLAALVLATPLRFVSAGPLTDDMVGQNEQAWTAWQAATGALERDDRAAAETGLAAVAGMDLSDLRLALMADRTGSLRLEQWAKDAEAPDAVRTAVERIAAGRRQKALAEDGWHFAAIGRFEYADANFKALAESNPDPVALLELSRQNPNRHQILVKLITNTEVGPSAKRFLEILNEGEERLRQDPFEITRNIEKLGGSPRVVFHATTRLKESGEYAIPHLIDFLRDPDRRALHPAIIQVIPQIGRAALNPLCIALAMDDAVPRKILIDAAARIGYRQALPYLAKVAADENASEDVRSAARQAMGALSRSAAAGGRSALFLELAENYYNNADAVRADPRRDTANVWYLRDGRLQFVAVPTTIWNDVMAMRCSTEALLAEPNTPEATALWLAADFRREAKLGLNVESDQPDPLAAKDSTRPENYPRSIHFARAAGAQYNHMVLARAFKDRDPGVALGAIAALSETAGAAGLVGAEDYKQALVQTLAFPNRQVRIKAALAIARALPTTSFLGSENVIPVLNEALGQAGRQSALIADPDAASANRFQAILRAAGFDCAVGATLDAARESASRADIVSYDLILLASDLQGPDPAAAVAQLRRDLPTSATPILIIAKADGLNTANRVARAAAGVEVLLSDVTELGDPAQVNEQVMTRVARASQALGMSPLGKELSMELALRTADALRGLAESGRSIFDLSRATPALVSALSNPSQALRVRCAHALALAADGRAQAGIAEGALNAERARDERIAMFGSLAESARRNGNLLGAGDLVDRLIEFAMNEPDLVLRAAASKALGALDLPSNKASEIIRAQFNG